MNTGSRVAWVLLAVVVAAVPSAHADREADLEALREAIRESRDRVASYERDERGLLEAIEALDRTAELLAREVSGAQRAAAGARRELSALEAEAGEVEQRLAATRRALRARAVALYRAGELGGVRVLFAAADLMDFLSRVSALRRLLRRDVDLLARFRTEVADLNLARARASASSERLETAESDLERKSAELVSERTRKRRLVARLHADRTRERSALVELEKAAQALEATLASLGANVLGSPGKLNGPPFTSLRRALAPPVEGEIVRGYGRQVDAEFGTQTFHSGVVFDARHGTPVEAVAPGSVRFAGWFRGYGRLVILDHGEGYFTVTGHLDAFDVAVGDTVARRQRIGRVGETGSLSGPRVYFEVRRGGEALDPADWLQ